MSFCPQCSKVLEENPAKPGVIAQGTAEGRFYPLWDRSYRDFRQTASYCKICQDTYSYQFEPDKHGPIKGVLELSGKDRDKLFVTCELYWTGALFDRLVIRFVERPDDEGNSEIWHGNLGYDIFIANSRREFFLTVVPG
jgi:hypothetical protein